MVSALDPTKRVATGIEAVSKIPDAHLVVAGDGSLRQQIDALAAELLPARYTRLQLPPEKIPTLYQSAHVFLHLSQTEPFGNVFLEAIASGLPVVGFDSPRSRWILGDHEYLVSNEDPGTIAIEMLRARDEPSILRQSRIERAATFSWRNIAKQYRGFLEEVVMDCRKFPPKDRSPDL
jgi:glycosyltransferase involved in cell wall biosynthesis